MVDERTCTWGQESQGESLGRQTTQRQRRGLGRLRGRRNTSLAGGLLTLGLLVAGCGEDAQQEPTKAQTVADVAATASPTPDAAAEQAAAAEAQRVAEAKALADKAAADKAAAAEAAAAKAAAAKAAAAQATAAKAAAAKAAAAKAAADEAAATRAAAERAAAQEAAEQEAANAVYYDNCTEVRAAGAAPIRRGEPGYSDKLDRDGDGTACDT